MIRGSGDGGLNCLYAGAAVGQSGKNIDVGVMNELGAKAPMFNNQSDEFCRALRDLQLVGRWLDARTRVDRKCSGEAICPACRKRNRPCRADIVGREKVAPGQSDLA